MKERGSTYALVLVALCIDWSQAVHVKKEGDYCRDASEENKLYPDPTDCSKYFQCHQGLAFSLSCPSGLLFNPSTRVCDFASNVKCSYCGISSDENKLYPDPKDCSKYFQCHQGQAVSLSCPSGLLFNPSTRLCDFASNVKCNGTQISTTPSPVSPTSSPDYCRDASEENKFYPDPKDCSKYFQCRQRQAFSLSCPSGLLFNPSTRVCDFASNVKCNNLCQNKADETYIADPQDCKLFYGCLGGRAVKFTCPPGTTWDQAILACDVKRADC